ncbi:serine hydrolase domain-containing protein [Nocardioides acrostichi]|uniref:Beta-lactamase family protein n=1 Tax=Nocardioides acrostichi TaxID=2784339 RepID=A0A930UX48_9ACTN|nr:serine hydrolase domain-containing protein [Nocardioides acrostichi]MBF4162498.1 beta-lactamase family protein [Nocardioides acrostichi]
MVEGTCTDTFAPLRDLLEQHLASGDDTGASLAVVHDGQLVVDLWGGEARAGEAWTRETIVQVYSVTKVMAALAFLTLVEAGEIDLDAPVTTYWPDFGAHGKGDVLVRQVLGHASRVPGWTTPVTVDDILDLDASEALLAASEPWYTEGHGYQMIDHGHLLDAIAFGATGRRLADVLRDDVMAPLGCASRGGFHLGVPEESLADCADLIPPTGSSIDVAALGMDHPLIRTVVNPLLAPDVVNGEAWRRGAVGGAGGHGTARAIARAQAVVSHGGELDGVRLLSPELVERIFEVQADGPDHVLVVPTRFGIGWALPFEAAPAVPSGRVCWWTGYGGAIVVNDLDRRLTLAYAPARLVDHMVASPRTDAYVRTTFDCLEALA